MGEERCGHVAEGDTDQTVAYMSKNDTTKVGSV